MKLIHIISAGNNGGENIIQKYLNYITVYKKLDIQYELLVLTSNKLDLENLKSENLKLFKQKTTSNKCGLKRVWIKGIKELEKYLQHKQFTHIILRIDFIDKNILNFIKKYRPILEYPTPPIETTLNDRPFYSKLANKYNKTALDNSMLNLTIIDVKYPNSYLFHNSLVNRHTCKKNFQIDTTISVLLMSSKYGKTEYNGYDRFLDGLTKYYKSNPLYQFELYVAGKDIEGFQSMLNNDLTQNIKIHYLGFKTILELNQIIEKIDIGINDIGFHRKGLHYANTLKTIDFLTWNLPFIISHEDVNLNKNQSFYLKEIEDDSAINIERMIQFLLNIKKSHIQEMQSQTKEITLENRVTKFLNYIKEHNV